MLFIDPKKKKCLFCSVQKAKNEVATRDEMLSMQRLKTSFAIIFLLETKLETKFIEWFFNHS